MNDNILKQALEAAKDEMAKLLLERRVIDEKLSKLAPCVEYLSKVCDISPTVQSVPSMLDVGLSDAIRFVFKSASPRSGLTPTEVRDRLREQGFHLDRYANELPPIHNTIARLAAAGEIEPLVRPDGAKAHRWVSSLRRAILEIESPNVFTLSDLTNPTNKAILNVLGIINSQPGEAPSQPTGEAKKNK
jgi:hypothetical protein